MALKNKSLIIFLFILLIASFFRLWQLDLIPPGLYPDVAINGNDALDSLKSAPPAGGFKVFYPENNGREGLMMWLIALSFSVFGASIWSIKIVAAIIGILTVLGLYLLTKELLRYEARPRNIALLTSFFLAVSFWHTNFSRIGFRAILLPFVLVFAFYFLFKGFKAQKVWNFIVAGIFFGLGFYTYIPYRFIVLLLPLILFCWYLTYRKEKQEKIFLKSAVCCLLFIIIVALPIGIYFLQHPQDFIGRAAPISIFLTENPLKEFGKSLILHLGMFNFHGDNNWRHNFAGSPQLPWTIGILFLIGFILTVRRFFSSLRKKDCSVLHVPCFLFGWFFIMLLPGVLTYESVPHALRVIGVIPVVYIFAGIGGWWVYERLKPIVKNKKLFVATCFLFLFSVGYSEFDKYFYAWAGNPNVKDAFSQNYVEIGNYLNSLPEETGKYVIVNQPGVPVPWPDGIPMPAQTVMFIERIKYGSLRSEYILPENLEQIKTTKGIPNQNKFATGQAVIVPMRYDEGLFNELSQKFPQGEIKKVNEFLIYEIK